MKKNTVKKTKRQNEQLWLVTYSDLMTLLFALFVLLIGISKFDKSKYEQIRQSVTDTEISKEEEKTKKLIELELQKDKELTKNIKEALKSTNLGNKLKVIDNKDGTKIILPDNVLFETGKAKLSKEALVILSKIVDTLKDILKQKNVYVKISGHTDEVPISNKMYKSNWDLSGARAASVANYFHLSGVNNSKIRIEGFADTQPLVKIENNDTKKIILEKRSKNRRVELQVFYKLNRKDNK